jgi:hypothetical protein
LVDIGGDISAANCVNQKCAKVSRDVTKINKNPAFLLLTKQIVTIRREGLVQIAEGVQRERREKVSYAMKVSLRSRTTRLAGALAALWLCYASPAWAGGGGADSGSLLASLSQICSNLLIASCPQYPAYLTSTTPPSPVNSPATPIVVELAAWQNWNPDTVRWHDADCSQFGPLFEGQVNAPFYCPQIGVNATNPPANSSISGILSLQPPSTLASLASLAFTSTTPPMTVPPLTVTQNSDPTATSYVYAVVEGAYGQPNTLDLFLENLRSKGPGAVTVALPLAVLAKGASTENSVVATLNIPPACILSVLCPATVTVNLGGGTGKPPTYSAKSLGIQVTPFFGPSAHSATPHWIYEVQIALLVNLQTDPFYFLNDFSLPQCPNGINQVSGICNAFSQTNPPNGFLLSSKILRNTVVGMAPSAAPQCPGPQPGAACPTPYPTSPPPVPQPVSPTFGFCASFSNNLRNPDAAFFLAIGPDGTTYVSSPVNLSSASADALPPGGPYPACPTS